MTWQQLYETPVPAAEAIVDVLISAGIKYVFGLSGGHTGRIFGALEKRQNQIRTILVREESLGAVMAETVGRMTGVPGVLLGQGPWVLGNGMLGTIEAHLSSSPMLLLTDFSDTPGYALHAPYQSGTGEYGNWDARQAFAAITKQVFTADAPNPAVIGTQLAIKHALAGTPGPVAMIYGLRALDGTAGGDSVPRIYPTAPYITAANPGLPALRPALDLLGRAARPLIIAGNGVRVGAAEDALTRFADKTGIPVVTSPAGKGVFDDNFPQSCGVYGGYGNPLANCAVGRADVILAIGTKLSASDTVQANPDLIDPTRQALIQIDIEPRNASWTLPATQTLIGDAAAILDALTAQWPDGPASDGWHRALSAPLTAPLPSSAPGATSIYPHEIIQAMQDTLPPRTIYTCDAGENRIFMLHCLRTQGTGKFIQPAGAGPMGYAVPSAMARKLLSPDSPVVAFCGDGGFSMTMNGLLTAVEAALPVLCVVMNNDALGWSQHSRGPFATQFNRVDYAAIARGMGCDSYSAAGRDELTDALTQAVDAMRTNKRPAVIDVRTSMDVSFARLAYSETRALGLTQADAPTSEPSHDIA
ncbi:thiamine pyrophosphate-binding protein (plasmid) [Pseudohalocynthiibacter aestuariivivens]|nr:thiamine pyrophosphate-binding protein [Pseudohalocynthiibacter aestuariivivens]QIE47762.1 thiamine pyrophosphate-binding protein [Pseudohalocynthiibacter aestuariivivens]